MKHFKHRLLTTLLLSTVLISACAKTAPSSQPSAISTKRPTLEGRPEPTPRPTKQLAAPGLFTYDGILEATRSLTGTGGGVIPIKDSTPYTGGEITLPVKMSFSAYNDLSNVIIILDGIPQMFTVVQEDPAEGQDTPALNHYIKHPQNIKKGSDFTFHVKFTPSVGKKGDLLACGMIIMNLPDVWFDPECCNTAINGRKIYRASSTYLQFETDGNSNQPLPPLHPSSITCSSPTTATNDCNAIYSGDELDMRYSISTTCNGVAIIEDNPTPIKYSISIYAPENSRLSTLCIIDKTPVLIGERAGIQHGMIKRGEMINASFDLDISKTTGVHSIIVLGNLVAPWSQTKSGLLAIEGDAPYYYSTIFSEAEFPNHLFQ